MEAPREDDVYALLRPYTAAWFRERYGSFTEPQLWSIPLIKAGKNVLISSPTGTGKTLAAFLAILDELFSLGERGLLEDKIYAVYVSPLRALDNDMYKNLLVPLTEVAQRAKEMGYQLPEVRVATRTSDTSPNEKQRMVRRPPHVLITTPESLAISLVAPRFRERLSTTRWVIVDEIHELASSKRGSHLALTLERLGELVREAGNPGLQRIGLSATIAPLEDVALFLGGYGDDGRPRPVEIVDARFSKPFDVRVVTPKVDLIHGEPDKINEEIYNTIAELSKTARTTLVFTNTRSATERVVFKLKKLMSSRGYVDMDEVEAHHSSLSREVRLEVEDKLKRGQLKMVVSSTSLELGIDIGYIDLVVLLSSPKSVSRLLQRVGRSGHHITQVSRGVIVVVDRDDLVECTVLARAAMDRKIDRVHIPVNSLDVLAQHLVGMSIERRWRVDDAYRVIRRAYPFHALSWDDYMAVLRFLGREDPIEEGVYSKIRLDEDLGEFGRKRSARMIYQLNAGTIPDEAKMKVISRGRNIGSLEEEFVEILEPGDVFVLGGKTYRFLRADGMRVYVEPAENERPTVPSWFSEMLPLAFDSAILVGEFRERIAGLIGEGRVDEARRVLLEEYRLEPHAAEEVIQYIWEQLAYVGVVPGRRTLLIEYFQDDTGEWNVVFHTLFGRRVNDALSRAYASVLSDQLNVPIKVSVTDNAFMLTYEGRAPSESLVRGLLSLVTPEDVRRVLERAVSRTEMMRRRFRHVAQRSFMILRRYRGHERSPERMQLSAQRLLEVMLEEMPDSPVVRETYREILEDYMDIANARRVLEWLREGDVKVVIRGPLPYPSPLAHNTFVRGYSDVVLMEDKRRILAYLHDKVVEVLRSRAVPTGGADGEDDKPRPLGRAGGQGVDQVESVGGPQAPQQAGQEAHT
ncbi:MAG: ATP-dependent helicase [Acidilobus sp.]